MYLTDLQRNELEREFNGVILVAKMSIPALLFSCLLFLMSIRVADSVFEAIFVGLVSLFLGYLTILMIKEIKSKKDYIRRLNSREYRLFNDIIVRKKYRNKKKRLYIKSRDKYVAYNKRIWFDSKVGDRVHCIQFDNWIFVFDLDLGDE